MYKPFKGQEESKDLSIEGDLLVLVRRLEQRLISLERKVDTLIEASKEKPVMARHSAGLPRGGGHRYFGGPREGGRVQGDRSFERGSREGRFRGGEFRRGQGHGYNHPKKRPFHKSA